MIEAVPLSRSNVTVLMMCCRQHHRRLHILVCFQRCVEVARKLFSSSADTTGYTLISASFLEHLSACTVYVFVDTTKLQ